MIDLQKFKRVLFYGALTFLVVGLLFDATVTYTAFKVNNQRFTRGELNTEIVGFLNDGQFPVFNAVVLLLPLSMFFALYYLTKKRPFSEKINDELEYGFLFFAILMIHIGSIHLLGGFSWWTLS